jgi:outer membrane immunogenic protein
VFEDTMPGSLRAFALHLGLRSTSTALLLTLAVLTGPAKAADFSPPIRAPLPPAIFCWTGFYLGVDTGWAWGKDTTTEYLTATNTFTGFNPTYRIKSPLAGLYTGYNYQIGNAVLGVETDIEGANLNGGFLDTVVGGAGTTQLDWQGSLRGRLGFAADRVMVYGTGGLAYADISHTYTNLVTGVAETTSAIRTGWTAGAGVEVAVMPNVLVRAEYRYTDYGPYRYDSVTAFPGFSGVQEPHFGSVRVGAAYKF